MDIVRLWVGGKSREQVGAEQRCEVVGLILGRLGLPAPLGAERSQLVAKGRQTGTGAEYAWARSANAEESWRMIL